MLVVRILPWTRFFCNVHLFRVPRRWTGSVQMKSSMTFIRGNRCIEREKDTFKGEVNWFFNVTINDISVIYVTAHICAGGLKK